MPEQVGCAFDVVGAQAIIGVLAAVGGAERGTGTAWGRKPRRRGDMTLLLVIVGGVVAIMVCGFGILVAVRPRGECKDRSRAGAPRC